MNSPLERKRLDKIFESFFHGKYEFSDFIETEALKESRLIKSDSGNIYEANEKLKDYHKFINRVVLENLEVDQESVFSYRKGVGVRDAIEKHSGGKFFFQTDIKNFFSSITVKDVYRVIEERSSLVPVSDISYYKNELSKCLVVDEVLPIGFSTSPLISNSVLYEFDIFIKGVCKGKGVNYTRYSDDIIFSGVEFDDVYSMESIVNGFFNEFYDGRFKLNKSKTKRKSVSNKVKLLGLVINSYGGVTVDSSFKKELEVLIYFYLSDVRKFSDYCGSYEKGIKVLKGKVNYVNSVDKKYLVKLKRKFGVTVVDMALKGELE